MDYVNIINNVLIVIGGSTIILRVIAPITKTKLDNKVLRFLELIAENVAVDSKAGILKLFSKNKAEEIKIKLKR